MLPRPPNLVRLAKRVRNVFREPPPRNKELVFEGYEVAHPELRLRFRALGREHVSRIVLHDIDSAELEAIGREALHALMVNAGLLFAPAHFRIADFATVRCACASLDDGVSSFAEHYWRHMLAEFRYLAGLDPTRPIRCVSGAGARLRRVEAERARERVLLLNGGGKDCAVAAELLKRMGADFAWCSVGPCETRRRVIEASRIHEFHDVSYAIAPTVAPAAVHGFDAVPYLATVYASSLIVAYVRGFRYIAAGNERSADVGNLVFRGMDINHQYEKSLDFEARHAAYIDAHVVRGIDCFSLLRPFYEIRLARIFSACEPYFRAFVSCNNGVQKGRWCGRCEKCAFVFLVLYPFLEAEKLRHIFGGDLLSSPGIRTHIRRLVADKVKPWECVGTREECTLALALVLRKSPGLDFPERPRRRDLERLCEGFDLAGAQRIYLEGFHEPHRVPARFLRALRSAADSFATDPFAAR